MIDYNKKKKWKVTEEKRQYTEEFKTQIVNLYYNGKKHCVLIREYELIPSALNNWIKQYTTSESFKAKNNRTEEANRLIELEQSYEYLKKVGIIMDQ